MHQPIPLADLQKRARCNTQLKNHGFCTVEDGESDHEHAIPDLFNAPNKHYNLNNRSSSSQGSSYGRELPSTPSNEDVSTESSRGSSYRHNASALATRGASPHRSAKECPLPHIRIMETDRLLRQHAGTQHHQHHDAHTLSMAYAGHSTARYSQILPPGPVPPISDVMLGQMDFEIAFTGVEMGVHIAGTVVVSALIALSVWLTITNVTL